MTAHAVGALLLGSADNWNFNASNPCLYFGGNYNQNGNHGLFYVNYTSASNSNANIGCRVLLWTGYPPPHPATQRPMPGRGHPRHPLVQISHQDTV
jgi:hypothetical protein